MYSPKPHALFPRLFFRSIAPVVLVLFLSTNVFATMLYQDGQYNQDIKYKFYYKSIGATPLTDFVFKPRTGDKFTLNMQAFYKGNRFKEIKLVNSGEFKSSSTDYQYGDYVFYLIAPSAIGTYMCTFEGTTFEDARYSFSVPISIESQGQMSQYENTMNIIVPIVEVIAVGGLIIILAMAMSGYKP